MAACVRDRSDGVSPRWPGRGGAPASAALCLPVLREARSLPDEGVFRVRVAGEPALPHRPRLHHHRLQCESAGPPATTQPIHILASVN